MINNSIIHEFMMKKHKKKRENVMKKTYKNRFINNMVEFVRLQLLKKKDHFTDPGGGGRQRVGPPGLVLGAGGGAAGGRDSSLLQAGVPASWHMASCLALSVSSERL